MVRIPSRLSRHVHLACVGETNVFPSVADPEFLSGGAAGVWRQSPQRGRGAELATANDTLNKQKELTLIRKLSLSVSV